MVKKFILAVQSVIKAERYPAGSNKRKRGSNDDVIANRALTLVTAAETSFGGISSNQCERVLKVLSQPQDVRNETELVTLVPWLRSRSEIFNKCDKGKFFQKK